MEKHQIIAFGELLWDILPSQTVLGGAPFNFACRVNSLGDTGVPISRVGVDDLGRKALEQVRALGVSPDFVQHDADRPTGTVIVTLDQRGNPDYTIVKGVAYDYIAFDERLRKLAGAAHCICFGTLIQRAPVSRETLYSVLAAGPSALKFLDINLRKECYSPDTIRTSLLQANILKLNEGELLELGSILSYPATAGLAEQARRIEEEWSLEAVVVTLSERGVLGSSRGRQVYLPGYRVDLVDSLGSGDAFSAGFLQRWLRGASLEEACYAGNRLGALVATQTGGTMPVRQDELDEFEDTNPQRIIDPELKRLLG
jgi:fructokinase